MILYEFRQKLNYNIIVFFFYFTIHIIWRIEYIQVYILHVYTVYNNVYYLLYYIYIMFDVFVYIYSINNGFIIKRKTCICIRTTFIYSRYSFVSIVLKFGSREHVESLIMISFPNKSMKCVIESKLFI